MNLANRMLKLTKKSIPKKTRKTLSKEVLFSIKIYAKEGKTEYHYSCLGETKDTTKDLVNLLNSKGFQTRLVFFGSSGIAPLYKKLVGNKSYDITTISLSFPLFPRGCAECPIAQCNTQYAPEEQGVRMPLGWVWSCRELNQ